MKKVYLDAAKEVLASLSIKTNCFVNGHIVNVPNIVCIDDDVTSAMWAAKLYFLMHEEHGFYPNVICVGGKGLMSKHTHKCSEAELLSIVLRSLGVNPDNITLLGEGRNTGDNVLAVSHELQNGPCIWSVTKRLSLRLERTQAKQAPQLKSYYYVIEETVEEMMKVYNGKGLCGGEMLLHELASVLDRCEAYSGTFQAPLEFEVSQKTRDAAELLAKNFRLKLPGKTFKSYLQLVRLLLVVLTKKKAMRADLYEKIKEFREKNL